VQPNVGDLFPLAWLSDSKYDLSDVGRIGVLTTSPRELRLSFDESQVFASQGVKGIRVTRAGGDDAFGQSNDVAVLKADLSGFNGFVGADASPNENVVVVRFPEALPDDLYRVEVFSQDIPSQNIAALRNSSGLAFVPADPTSDRQTIDFRLDLGAQVQSVVPQPVERTVAGALDQLRNVVDVYFNNDDLWSTAIKTGDRPAVGLPDPAVVKPEYYQLIFTQETVRNTDDVVFTPTSISYDPATDKARLTFAAPLNELTYPTWHSLAGQPVGHGTFRLRVGTNEMRASDKLNLTQEVEVIDSGNGFGDGQVMMVSIAAQNYPTVVRKFEFDPAGNGVAAGNVAVPIDT
ncbi:MAG TPA: hypothetical protein PLV92_29745, partial [Pirellulaceae bacterium]|nr:hypothetical protein [Pirellulaceae bacterium]